jgi:hypothetical protein
MRTLGDTNQQRKLEEKQLAEKLFISMVGNSELTKDKAFIVCLMEDAFKLAKEFKSECRDRYDQ